jgi:hypothetical protein
METFEKYQFFSSSRKAKDLTAGVNQNNLRIGI